MSAGDGDERRRADADVSGAGGAAGGIDALVVEPAGPLHRAPAAGKLAGVLGFVFAVVTTPTHAVWAFGLHATALAIVVVLARLPLRVVLRRLTIEVPFLAFAALMPFVGPGPDVDVLGVGLSRAGLWSAWGIGARGSLGVGASIVLGATTTVPDLLDGLRRWRVPALLVATLGFMVRYAAVLTGEMQRMRVARISRGADPRWLWQGRAIAASAGALFVRSYERGERVHLAMAARGFDGTFPDLHEVDPSAPRTSRSRATVLTVVFLVAAATISIAARGLA